MEVANIAKENDSEDENLTEAEKALRKSIKAWSMGVNCNR